jgi:hypothetical protein
VGGTPGWLQKTQNSEIHVLDPNKLKLYIPKRQTREIQFLDHRILENGPAPKSGLSNTQFNLKFDDFLEIMGGTPGWPPKNAKLEKYPFWTPTLLT